jgi:hypothetical protein
MSDVKYGATDPDDFDRAFGEHRNINECCTENFIRTRDLGPCKRCELKMKTSTWAEWHEGHHFCTDGEPGCEPFLQYIHERTLADELEGLERGEGFSSMTFYRNGDSDERVNARISLYEAHGYAVEPTDPACSERFPVNEGWHVFPVQAGKLLQFQRA